VLPIDSPRASRYEQAELTSRAEDEQASRPNRRLKQEPYRDSSEYVYYASGIPLPFAFAAQLTCYVTDACGLEIIMDDEVQWRRRREDDLRLRVRSCVMVYLVDLSNPHGSQFS